MTKHFQKLIEQSKQWLTQDVFPLWSHQGIDQRTGGFVESLSFEGQAMDVPRRAMVQSRQIYSFLTGAKLGCCSETVARVAVEQGTHYLMENFSLPSGAFIYSINPDGSPKGTTPDLYTQAFALFGLAQAYRQSPQEKYKTRAQALVAYLYRERHVATGGFTEINDQGEKLYRSNPHMHLFEGVIAWMQVDSDPVWKKMGAEIVSLCLNKFIDSESQVLGEYFDEHWNHLREEGRFIYEPGHQYEWAWLLSLYENLTGQDLKAVRHRLFLLAEKHGTSRTRKIVFDEMWSDYTPKTTSSRFWPQCERIKAAVRLGHEVPADQQAPYAEGADEALQTLFRFFETPRKGLWYDMLSDQDSFNGSTAKASSLYHIINAMEEYIELRPGIKD